MEDFEELVTEAIMFTEGAEATTLYMRIQTYYYVANKFAVLMPLW